MRFLIAISSWRIQLIPKIHNVKDDDGVVEIDVTPCGYQSNLKDSGTVRTLTNIGLKLVDV